MKKHIKHALLCLLIVVMALGALTGCGGKKQIDLHDYVEVTLSKADGYGQARAVTDDASLEALVLSDGADKKSDLEILTMWDLLAKVDYTLDKTDHLSNGDIITVTVTYPDALEEALNAKITPESGDSWTVEVKVCLNCIPLTSLATSRSASMALMVTASATSRSTAATMWAMCSPRRKISPTAMWSRLP